MPARKRRPEKPKPRSARRDGAGPARGRRPALGLRRVGQTNEWELVHPRCAQQRAEDLAEVAAMIEAGETEIARDELRWLLNGCPDCLDAHRLLGELALVEGDVRLARGHFGYAYDLGLAAIPDAKGTGTLPCRLPSNQGFFLAGKGLAHCLRELGSEAPAREVESRLLALDPSTAGHRVRLDRPSGQPPS
ncbi:MAG: hypothetical protein HYX69_08020 [Planctomycetia bacterium]|nr:hypothetical protein [Planctomycetia bacterium]